MSSKNNVNPDHYKVAGRDRPNEVIPPEHTSRDIESINAKQAGRRKNLIPGGAPVGESAKADEDVKADEEKDDQS
jgi:hypothetical protein